MLKQETFMDCKLNDGYTDATFKKSRQNFQLPIDF